MHRRIVLALLIATTTLAACASATAAPQISVEEAWARPVPLAGGNGVLYFRLVNDGGEADRLLGGESPLARAVEIHKTAMSEGVMKMEPISDLLVPAGEQVQLEPGGFHMMLIGVNRELATDDRLPITLRFEKSGEIPLDVQVREISGHTGNHQ